MAEPAVKELTSQHPDIEVRWRAFELRPYPVPTLEPNGDYLVSAWKNHVYPLAAQIGITMKRPPIQPRSRLAHEAAKWAETMGHFKDYNLALFRTLFEYGKDIEDIAILKELASDLKLDTKSLELSLSNNEFAAAVIADQEEAKQVGVRAVPAFVVNGMVKGAGVQSAQRLYEFISENQKLVRL